MTCFAVLWKLPSSSPRVIVRSASPSGSCNDEHEAGASLITIFNVRAHNTNKTSNCCVYWLHFVYSDFREARFLFSIYTTFVTDVSSTLTCLTDTVGAFCFCRVSLMCKAEQIKPSREDSDLCHSQCHLQVHSRHWAAPADGQQRPATGVIPAPSPPLPH